MNQFGWLTKGISITLVCSCLSVCTGTVAQARDNQGDHQSGIVDRAPDAASVSPPAAPDAPPDAKTPARDGTEAPHAPPGPSTVPAGQPLNTTGAYGSPDISPAANGNTNPATGPGVLMNNPNNVNSSTRIPPPRE